MNYYQANPACNCGRCRTRGLMGPAVLITLGLLFLLANTTDYAFHRTWPILLIVIGGIQIFRYVIPDQGHISSQGYAVYGVPYPPPGPYGYQPYPGGYDNGPVGAQPASSGVTPEVAHEATSGATSNVTSNVTPQPSAEGGWGDAAIRGEEERHD